MLETVPSIVAEALAVGAVAGLGDAATQAVVDAYQKLKEAVSRRYGRVDIESLEQQPDSGERRASLVEDLRLAGADGDGELLAAAQALIAAVRVHEAAAGMAVGVDLERVAAAALRIRDVSATGTGVRVVDSDFAGDIEIGSVRTGHDRNPPTAHR
ncbi:hypothetical protein ACWIGW_01170 [Nocardia brasiliensis]